MKYQNLYKVIIAVLLISIVILIAKITAYESKTYLVSDGATFEVYRNGTLLYEFHEGNCDSSQIDLLMFMIE